MTERSEPDMERACGEAKPVPVLRLLYGRPLVVVVWRAKAPRKWWSLGCRRRQVGLFDAIMCVRKTSRHYSSSSPDVSVAPVGEVGRA